MKVLLASLVLLLVTSTATAAGADKAIADQDTWYVGIGGGQSGISNVCSGTAALATVDTCDDQSVAWKILLGRKLSKLWAFEFAYVDAGDANVTASAPAGTLVVNPRMFAGYGILDMPVTNRLSLFAKVGIAFFSTTFERTGSFRALPSGDDGLEGALGAGVSWRGYDHVSVRAEWEHFNDAGSIDSGDINMATISLIYHF